VPHKSFHELVMLAIFPEMHILDQVERRLRVMTKAALLDIGRASTFNLHKPTACQVQQRPRFCAPRVL
jgi:hypothetical protein